MSGTQDLLRRTSRALLLLLVVAGVLLGPAAPAAAHGGEAPDATAYRITVTGIDPPRPGLTVRAVEAGTRLELTNDTGRPVEVLGYSGEPYLEVRPDGTYENVHSPATYLNRTLAGDTPVPATAAPTATPQWRRVSTGTTVRWHDQRLQWRAGDPPPAARADPSRPHRLRTWTVPLRDQTQIFEVRGTLDWVPPPRAPLWWAGALLLAVAVAALGRWRPALIPAVALVAGTIPIGYAAARAADSGLPPVLLAAGLVTLTVAVWRTPFLTALGGAVLATFGGLAEIGAFGAAVVPSAGPSWFARVAVLVALGAGAGLALTGVRRLRASAPRPLRPDVSDRRTKVVP
ncbi:hypothetical protein [Jidongwangia harbinensis]|uniref:hypothetical protein n=1 Tax=Jidongwangia harbinensis TaxID=2878561 RepID=UPI001CDA1E94|nr:hypothetical protein [Jidongwangia harbinensis]MCA2215434.1 hypothetical protein [Jidongwangia harbinensis]